MDAKGSSNEWSSLNLQSILMAAPRFIYHIVCLSDWEKQKSLSQFTASSLDAEGFIHCSKEEQISGTLKRFFKNRNDLRVLKIDTSLLNVPVIYEAADDGSGFFPHVFGTIAMRAIADVEMPRLQKV